MAAKSKECLERHGIWVLNHPPHSLDLVWKKMKEVLRREYPGLYDLKKNAEISRRRKRP